MSEDYGKHLMGVDDLLQKHSLLEADIHVLGERVKTVNLQAMKFVDGDFSEVGGNLTVFTDIRNKSSALLSAVVLCRAYSGSEFAVANTLAKLKKLEPNEINFGQGFSQKVISTSCFAFYSLLARCDFFVVC